jgi:tetratricopeptide (TPR) repeat protein
MNFPAHERRSAFAPVRALAFLGVAGTGLLGGGCVTELPENREGGGTVADRQIMVPERDRVLFDYRLAATALRRGDDAVARKKLDDAIARIGGIIANSTDAARARGLFASESSKTFIGEPYERAMAYYYRGILYWRDGQPDNARACFRSGQVIDSDATNEHYDADYVLLDYLDGLATAKLGGDGSDALARAQRHAGERLKLPSYQPDANVLVFAEYGYGPRKYAAGQYGELLRFYTDDSPSRAARLVLDGGTRIIPLPAYDDLGFQATTRGGRVMDHILGNKAVFKSGANLAGDVALAGSAIAQDKSRRREREGKDTDDSDFAAVSLGVLGIIGKVASAATDATADTRQWDNLPQRLSFAALKLAPGQHTGRIEFLDRDGNVLEQRTQAMALNVGADDRDTVVFLSELKR